MDGVEQALDDPAVIGREKRITLVGRGHRVRRLGR
jgi:hypothetical protein